MFEFLGQFMGLAIRTKTLLNVRLPAIVWKQLCSEAPQPEDVMAIDHLSFQIIEQINKTCKAPGITVDSFNKAMKRYKFVVQRSDSVTVPLVRDGEHKSITWENKDHYIASFMEFRLSEFAEQCLAIRRGLATVVPYRLLTLFSWREVERAVCGIADIDVDLLYANTTYCGHDKQDKKISAASPHVKLFWRMLRERFNNKQRTQFLVFTWGRSRLPLTSAGFERKFGILPHVHSNAPGKNPNQYFPAAHTCFFQLELPCYTNLNSMTSKFLYAIANCTSIDGDQTATALATARMAR